MERERGALVGFVVGDVRVILARCEAKIFAHGSKRGKANAGKVERARRVAQRVARFRVRWKHGRRRRENGKLRKQKHRKRYGY